MATHRGSERRWVRPRRLRTIRTWHREDQAATVVKWHQAQVFDSAPFTIDQDHPWHNVPCLICWTLPGNRLMKSVSLVLPSISHAHSWAVETLTCLICDTHDLPDCQQLQLLVHHRLNPTCPRHAEHLPHVRGFVATSHPEGIFR